MKVVMIGGTGAVGTELLRECVSDPRVTAITLLGRRKVAPPEIGQSPKVKEHVVDVFTPDTYRQLLQGHTHAVSTLGVGEPSKVSREDYFKTDYTCVVDFATACKAAGVSHFSALVSVGADSKSKVYYLRVKGELEDKLASLQFDRVSFFEPSVIVTPQNRYGISQWLTLKLYPRLADPLLFGALSKFKSVKVEDLGRAMARNMMKAGTTPIERLHWRQFRDLTPALTSEQS